MSLQPPRRAAARRGRTARVVVLTAVGIAMLVLGGCSSDDNAAVRFAMPDPGSEQGVRILHLWQGAWVAAWITGIIVWALILYAAIHFRRRSADEIPIQTRYNLPLEIFYTVAPIIMVVVLFAHTVKTQNYVLDDDRPVDNTVEVTGQQWSWTFNYGVGQMDTGANGDPADDKYPYSSYVFDAGTGSHIPDLYLPVGKTTRFNLHSPDVIHDFGIPGFIMRMDVIPGRVNHYEITPTRTGDYRGKCYELCGVYHSRMLFDVHVVSESDYQNYLQGLQDAGSTAQQPLIGGESASTQAGLDEVEGEGK